MSDFFKTLQKQCLPNLNESSFNQLFILSPQTPETPQMQSGETDVNKLQEECKNLKILLHFFLKGISAEINNFSSFVLSTREHEPIPLSLGKQDENNDGIIETKDEDSLYNSINDISVKYEEEDYLKQEDLSEISTRRMSYWKQKKNRNSSQPKTSKAKHLWAAYGREISRYVLKYIDGKFKEKVKVWARLLTTKKGFSDVFRLQKEDTVQEIHFKRNFGKMAIHFIRNEIESAFRISKFSEDFINQRDTVANWIKKKLESLPEEI